MTQGGNLPLYHFHVPMGTLLSGFLFGLKNRSFYFAVAMFYMMLT